MYSNISFVRFSLVRDTTIQSYCVRAAIEGCNAQHLLWLSSLDVRVDKSGKLKIPLYNFVRS